MKKTIIMTIIIVQVVILQGCKIYTDKSTNISNYNHWPNSTKKIIQADFEISLPETEIVQKFGQSYYYNHSQAILGDENFIIHVVLKFPDIDGYEKELSKYASIAAEEIFQKDDTTHYLIQYSNEDLREYLNDTVLDGMFFNFETISANSKEYTLSFITARVWDYYQDDFLISYLRGQGDGLQ